MPQMKRMPRLIQKTRLRIQKIKTQRQKIRLQIPRIKALKLIRKPKRRTPKARMPLRIMAKLKAKGPKPLSRTPSSD